MRAVIYLLWKITKTDLTQEEFYYRFTENIINKIKAKLL
jgi:hypothetical protein